MENTDTHSKKEFEGNVRRRSPSIFAGKGNREVENFFIALAAVYNDLKGVFALMNLIDDVYRIPDRDKNEISAHVGERSGVRDQLVRILISITHEFLKLLEENNGVFSTSDFRIVLGRVRSTERANWKQMVAIATGEKMTSEATEFRKFLAICRNKVGFHYDSEMMRSGYDRIFFQRSKNAGNEAAMYSLESTMRTSRFYFADAAQQEAMALSAIKATGSVSDDDVRKILEMHSDFVSDMHRAIWHLLKEYINSRPH